MTAILPEVTNRLSVSIYTSTSRLILILVSPVVIAHHLKCGWPIEENARFGYDLGRSLYWKHRWVSQLLAYKWDIDLTEPSPFFYKENQAPGYTLGIGSILVCNCLEFLLFIFFRYAFKWENKKKDKIRAERGPVTQDDLNATAFQDLTDQQNPNFTYVY